MNPEVEKQLRLELIGQGAPTPEDLAKALKINVRLTGLQQGELMPCTKDYAVANRLRRNLFIKAFRILKAEGFIGLNRQRRHELRML